MLRKATILALGAAALAAVGSASTAIDPTVDPYAVGVPGNGYETTLILSVGDTVPETSQPGKEYQMVGIPDGLGAHSNGDGTATVYMNHEFAVSPVLTLSEPVIGDPLNKGAMVSKLIVDGDGTVLSGERAYDWVFNENVFHGPAAAVGNSTRPFSRFCSGSLAGPEQGFDRYIYLTNEEEGTLANTFDGLGGLAVAITGNNLYTLPKLGRFAWENTLVQPNHGTRTVIMGMEDGPSVLEPEVENSQVYMYVGKKERRSGASVLRRNGLDNGNLYVLAPVNPAHSSEAGFANGTIPVKWVNLGDVTNLDEAQLEAASDAAGAITFARPEDGAFNERNKNEFFFVTTGSNGSSGGALGNPNNLGRLYSLRLHPGNPGKDGTLTVVYNADQIIAAGGDIAISPDNMDTSDDYLMIQEDGTGSPAGSRAVMDAKDRDGSIWRFEIENGFVGVDASSATRVVELAPPGRDGINPGIEGTWETSGIIDVSGLFGRDRDDRIGGRRHDDDDGDGGVWLFDVQAHPATTAPGVNTVEDGQLLLLKPAGGADGEDGDDEDDD